MGSKGRGSAQAGERTPLTQEQLRLRLRERGTHEHYQDAALYDFEYADRHDDIEWYVGLATELSQANGRPLRILELGAGTGRITLALLASGHHVTALDRMAPMLASLQAKAHAQNRRPSDRARLRILEADMTAPPVDDGTFDLVLAPFNTLMHLYEHADLQRCFGAAYRALADGGTFALDVLLPDLEWLMWDPSKRHGVTYFKHPTSGERLVYSTNHTYDPATQICHVRIFYDDAPNRPRAFKPPPVPKHMVHLAHRQIFPEELRALVATSGFSLDSHTGDFYGAALTADIESQVIRCRKPQRKRPRSPMLG